MRTLSVKRALAQSAGLRLVEPFADGGLLAYMCTVPGRLKLRHMTQKYLTKRCLRSYLPRAIVHRAKVSNAQPLRPLLERGTVLRGLLADLRDADYSRLGTGMQAYFDRSVAEAERRNVLDGDLLYALNFHLWYQKVVRARA